MRPSFLTSTWISSRTVPPLVALGDQLFSALAGTLADAKTDGSKLAVVVV
jgi:hypothetical protein